MVVSHHKENNMSVTERIEEIRRELAFCERNGSIGHDLAIVLREELEFLVHSKHIA